MPGTKEKSGLFITAYFYRKAFSSLGAAAGQYFTTILRFHASAESEVTDTLDLADAGKEVVLVEKEPSIGGHMAKFDKTFPTLDCSACILTPRMV